MDAARARVGGVDCLALRCRYAIPGSKPLYLSATAEFVLTSGGPRGGNNHTAQIAEPAARVAAVSRRLAEPPLANVGRSRRANACHVRHLRAGIGSGGAGKAVLSEIGAAGQAWRDLGQLGSGQLDRVRGPQVWGEIPN